MSTDRAARECKLDVLHERMAIAVEDLVSGSDWVRAVDFAARFRSRSFGNTLLIYVQHLGAFEQGLVPEPVPTLVAGFQQWKQLGRAVLKGQPGYMIQAPVTGRFATTDPLDVESWRRLSRFEKPLSGEVVRSRLVVVKPAYVWDVSQTAGDPLPERPRPRLLEGRAPAGLWDGLAAQIETAGFRVMSVSHAGMIGGANGQTDYGTHTVAVRKDMDDAARVKTLAHELGHILLGHEHRSGEGLHGGIGEVEAESVAMMVTAVPGMDSTGYTFPYVASWSCSVEDKTPGEVIRATGELVRKTALAILDNLPTASNDEGGDPAGVSWHVAAGPAPAGRRAARSSPDLMPYIPVRPGPTVGPRL